MLPHPYTASLEQFRIALARQKPPRTDAEWLVRWVNAYLHFQPVLTSPGAGGSPPLTAELVIEFLRSRRDRGAPARQRLQMAEALELYQSVISPSNKIAFQPIRAKLTEISRRELAAGPQVAAEPWPPASAVPGEGSPAQSTTRNPA